MKTIKVRIKYYCDKKRALPSSNCGYRPHFVISGDTEMLGVEFLELDLAEFNKFGEAVVKLLYDNVDYFKLAKGATFNIVEGAIVVGEGKVLE